MTLNFNSEDLFAIYRIASMMANADGVVYPDEERCISDEMAYLGAVTSDERKNVEENGTKMKPLTALNIIEHFNAEQKKYINAFLGNIISIDGDIADAELALWRLVGELCDLPKMSVRQAINLFANR